MDTELRYDYTLIKSVYNMISVSEPHNISNSKISTLPQNVGILKFPEEYSFYETPQCYQQIHPVTNLTCHRSVRRCRSS